MALEVGNWLGDVEIARTCARPPSGATAVQSFICPSVWIGEWAFGFHNDVLASQYASRFAGACCGPDVVIDPLLGGDLCTFLVRAARYRGGQFGPQHRAVRDSDIEHDTTRDARKTERTQTQPFAWQWSTVSSYARYQMEAKLIWRYRLCGVKRDS